jgi:hypothetical protein
MGSKSSSASNAARLVALGSLVVLTSVASVSRAAEGDAAAPAAPNANAPAAQKANAPAAPNANAPAANVAKPVAAKSAVAKPAAKANANNTNNANVAGNARTASAAKGAKTAPANVAAKPNNAKPGAHAQLVSTDGNGAPVVTAVPTNGAVPGAGGVHLDEHVTYQYDALGRRDPFQSLVDGAFVGFDVGGDAPPDPGGMRVVGIVWGATDQFALVEDVRGNSFVLRKGDKVQNGFVEGLKRDGVIVNLTAEGQTQSVVIPLVRKGDQNAR